MDTNTQLRILMTADTVGGVWTYAMDLARALQPHVKIGLATMGAPLSPQHRREVDQLSNVELFESEYKLEWMDDPWADVSEAGKWLRNIEKRFRPDLVHLNNYAHAALKWRAPTLVVAHSCVYSWWDAVHRETAPANFDRYRRAVREGLHAADVVVAPTRAMLRNLELFYGALPNARVVHNGSDPGRFSPGAKEHFLFTVGRLWDSGKNVETAIRAAGRAGGWPLKVAGETRHPDGGNKELEGAEMLGRLASDQLARWYARAPVFVYPARYEPFGLSVLEAALSGCALVLGDIPTLRELWDGAALFVDPDDEEMLAGVLGDLMTDVRARNALMDTARLRARRYSLGRMAARYWGLYHDLLEGRYREHPIRKATLSPIGMARAEAR